MQHDFWLARWQQNQIGFHNTDINHHLKRNWSSLDLPANSTVFVPLCGKSKDLLWLRQQGYQVIGVELSRLAVEAFFTENDLSFASSQKDGFECFETEGIQIYCGDFFVLPTQVLKEISAVYDRASLVALPCEMREQYISKMKTLLPENTQTLLVAFTYPQHEMQAPPFSVDNKEVERLFNCCEIKHLYSEEIRDKEPHFKC
jgi:thiopurine S-methyltransferase